MHVTLDGAEVRAALEQAARDKLGIGGAEECSVEMSICAGGRQFDPAGAMVVVKLTPISRKRGRCVDRHR